MKKEIASGGLKIVFVSSWPPRQCGIGTFTQDLCNAILKYNNKSLAFVAAINDIGSEYDYESIVKCEIEQENLDSLDRAARYINESGAGVVSIQHEFGIWGGSDKEFIGYFLKKIKIPTVTTLHTVPLTINAKKRESRIRLIRLMARYSKKIVVNIDYARKQLHNEYGIPEKKIAVIPHGAPDIEFINPETGKQKIGLAGKKVISTFGLITSTKGIEFVIEAMPEILKKHPDTIYQILGMPHPILGRHHPVSSSAKNYYQNLENCVKQLKLEGNVLFVNRYLTINEIIKYLQATDIYITPYLVPEQVSSGTLTYAVAAGKCVVSTRYAHANELLKDERGIFVEMKNSDAIAKTINYLLDHPEEIKNKMRQNYEYGRNFTWAQVAEKYFSVFNEVLGL